MTTGIMLAKATMKYFLQCRAKGTRRANEMNSDYFSESVMGKTCRFNLIYGFQSDWNEIRLPSGSAAGIAIHALWIQVPLNSTLNVLGINRYIFVSIKLFVRLAEIYLRHILDAGLAKQMIDIVARFQPLT